MCFDGKLCGKIFNSKVMGSKRKRETYYRNEKHLSMIEKLFGHYQLDDWGY